MTIHHQADPPGITWDLTIAGRRYLVVEDGPATDCGWPGSRLSNYGNRGCRCDTCRETRRLYVQARRAARVNGQDVA